MYSNYRISCGLLPDTHKQANERLNSEIIDYGKLDLSSINIVDFPYEQYYRVLTDKNQISMHHTVSGPGVAGDIRWWEMTKDRVATHVIVGREGDIHQCFSSKYWGHHLGVKSSVFTSYGLSDPKKRNVILNKAAIGIEIDSWGGLVKHNEKYYPAKWDGSKNIANLKAKPIAKKNVIEYKDGFRGFKYFERYTAKQIKALAQLLKYWGNVYDIPLDYNSGMWDVSIDALSGKSGVWGHTSYRSDKSDIHPQPNLIKMLKSLTK